MPSILHRTLAVTLALAVPAAAIATSPALAQKNDKAKKKQAKAYVDAGLAAYESGDYDAAVDFYQKAYDVLPHPVLLFNIAQAHRLAGRTSEAIDFYKKYLAADAKGAHVKEAKGFIKELEPIVARQAEELRRAEEAAAAEKARREAEAKPEAEPAPPEEAKPIALPPPEEEPPDEGGGGGGGMSGLRLGGIIAGGVGAVSIGAGVFFGLKASRLSDELSETGAYYDVDKIAEGEDAERNMFIAYGVGGVLVATGVVLFVLGGNDDAPADEEELSLTPVVGGDRAGLVLGGRF